nr:histidinol dehydrogenase [Serinicoccus sp. CUA-874]
MNVLTWDDLDDTQRAEALRRGTAAAGPEVTAGVTDILAQVRERGDDALRELTARLDGATVADLRVTPQERDTAAAALDPDLREAITEAAGRIRTFTPPTGSRGMPSRRLPGSCASGWCARSAGSGSTSPPGPRRCPRPR